MNNLLTKVLLTKGVNDLSELSDDDKQQFERWKQVLSKGSLTIEEVKAFCSTQIETIKQKWADYNIKEADKAELIPYFTVYSSILAAIDSPKVAKKAAEAQLKSMIK